MGNKNEALFCTYDLRAVIDNQRQQMLDEINSIEGNRLLNTSTDDLCDYFIDKYTIETPILGEISTDQKETKLDISNDFMRAIYDRSKPFYIDGTSFIFYIHFTGDSELFKCVPSSHDFNPPRGHVDQNELVLSYPRTDHDIEAVKKQFEEDLSSIHKYLNWMSNQVDAYNGTTRDEACKRIQARKEKLLKDQAMVAELGFPLRKREDAQTTYTATNVRRKPPIKLPSASLEPYTPEPVLEMREYEHILSVIDNMVVVMERSPHAFKDMGEEDIRQHFLVQLNGQYEGQATGETFNYEGKTDILIRAAGKNIFIAECKFWKGPESLKKTIDQILKYASWRDTKTAILVFNRQKNLSAVLNKIPDTVKGHKAFKREITYQSETGFQFILGRPDDVNREMILTTKIFEIPN